MIEVQDLSFAYHGGKPLFENLNFIVSDGELLWVNGASGAGKTTLLYCLCGVIKKNITGRIYIDGRAISDISCAELPGAAAMVFQEPGSRIFLSAVEDELAFTLENLCMNREEMRERINDALKLTGLTDKRHENPAKLSGGQIKLAALAAVLVYPPRVLLLDEITAGLDNLAVERVIDCVNMLRKKGCAVIVSDHNASIWRGGANELRI